MLSPLQATGFWVIDYESLGEFVRDVSFRQMLTMTPAKNMTGSFTIANLKNLLLSSHPIFALKMRLLLELLSDNKARLTCRANRKALGPQYFLYKPMSI